MRRIHDPRRDPMSKIKKHEQNRQDRSQTDRGATANAATFFPNGPSAPSTSWYIDITSGTFDTVWSAPLWIIYRRGLRVQVPWVTGAATTGEIRLEMAGLYTSAISLAGGSNGTATFQWAHGLEPWSGTQPWVTVQARRTGGANNVSIRYPGGGAAQVPPAGCTSTGV